jgi:DNA-binding transcriptional LysR family regulator
MHPRHPLARAREVSIHQLGAQNFVAHNIPSPLRQKVVQAFQRHKTPLNMAVELPSLEAIKRFVAMGNGVALLPGLTARPEIDRGELVQLRVPELSFERRLRIVHRRHANLSHASLAFLKVVESMAGERGDPFLFQVERPA